MSSLIAGSKNYAHRQGVIVGLLLFGSAALAKVTQDSVGESWTLLLLVHKHLPFNALQCVQLLQQHMQLVDFSGTAFSSAVHQPTAKV